MEEAAPVQPGATADAHAGREAAREASECTRTNMHTDIPRRARRDPCTLYAVHTHTHNLIHVQKGTRTVTQA